ncbi:MAG TPA: transketolase C-terminal domain-containing protein [Phycisphaerae bacterium]|nr:transketolase C-terminal domain-containing protein [Phycisphaerae bacterium]
MNSDVKLLSMRDALGQALVELAPQMPELVVLDADVSASTKTGAFAKAYPERFFNVGVAEANMADIAAGMASTGLRPVINTFSLFLALKCADQIRNTICYNNLPVVLAGAYGGLSDSYDGASHQAILDVAMMRALPNMVVIVPADAVEMKQSLALALKRNGPTFIRGCRNETPILFENAEPLKLGKARKLRDGKDLTIATCGVPVVMVMEAAAKLAKEGIETDVLALASVKPIDEQALATSAAKTGLVLAVEEHNIFGGLGGAVAEAVAKHAPAKMDFIGVQDRFTESGPYDALMKKYGISVEAIMKKAKALVASKPAVKDAAAKSAVKPAAKKAVAKKAVAKKAAKPAKKAAAKRGGGRKPAGKKTARRR